MKKEFEKKLTKNEKLLFSGKFNINKTSKQYGRFIILFIVLILFWILAVIGAKQEEKLNIAILIFIPFLLLITALSIYGLIYNIILKKKIKNNEYFITNKRIAIYNQKSGFRIEKISEINHLGVIRVKGDYADLIFNFKDQFTKSMSICGIENPWKVVDTISDINEKMHIYDDKPTVLGKEI